MPLGEATSGATHRLAPMPGRLPDFVIIGAQKAGTHWLRSNLNRHPDVHVIPSDLHYFNRINLWRGIDWYAEQFADRREKAVGEGTPGYMMWYPPGSEFVRALPHETARRMSETLPGVRLLAILRNPIDRGYSAFLIRPGTDVSRRCLSSTG